jgi:hypothetical protein
VRYTKGVSKKKKKKKNGKISSPGGCLRGWGPAGIWKVYWKLVLHQRLSFHSQEEVINSSTLRVSLSLAGGKRRE